MPCVGPSVVPGVVRDCTRALMKIDVQLSTQKVLDPYSKQDQAFQRSLQNIKSEPSFLSRW